LEIKKGRREAGFTAPPAKRGLAGGFRTFNSFQGFGHGDSGSFFKEFPDFDRVGLQLVFRFGCWISGFGLGLVFRFFSGFGLVFLRTWLGFLDIDIGLM
jgi:hypothetical protein